MSCPLVDFSGQFNAAFELAVIRQGTPPLEFRIKAAGRRFRLRFATAAMRDAMLPALRNLVIPLNHAEPDDFTLNIWESASTGVQPPSPAWPLKNPITKGEITELTDLRFAGHVSHESGAVSFYDADARTAIFWLADARNLRGHERAAPFLTIFQWCFRHSGRQITHAAVIGLPSGAALLAGKGGSGKSTTAALGCEAGLLHLGDDYCLLADDPPRAFTFYRSVKLHPRSLRLGPLESWSREAAWTAEEKDVLLLDGQAPREVGLKIILLPRVAGAGGTAVRPAGAAEALRALAPSTLFQLPGTTPSDFTFFARLVRQLPAFHLDLGTDPENVAVRVRELLEGVKP
jgi:hypothetical protein